MGTVSSEPTWGCGRECLQSRCTRCRQRCCCRWVRAGAELTTAIWADIVVVVAGARQAVREHRRPDDGIAALLARARASARRVLVVMRALAVHEGAAITRPKRDRQVRLVRVRICVVPTPSVINSCSGCCQAVAQRCSSAVSQREEENITRSTSSCMFACMSTFVARFLCTSLHVRSGQLLLRLYLLACFFGKSCGCNHVRTCISIHVCVCVCVCFRDSMYCAVMHRWRNCERLSVGEGFLCRVCAHACVCACVRTCMHVCMRARVHVCM